MPLYNASKSLEEHDKAYPLETLLNPASIAASPLYKVFQISKIIFIFVC
jgi:hypothetical protein